jgi:replicative DNA helicase Mcm
MEDPIIENFEEFLRKYYSDAITELSVEYPAQSSLNIDYLKLDQFSPKLAQLVRDEPDEMLELLRMVLQRMDLASGVALEEAQVRVIKVPDKLSIRDIRNVNLGKLIAFEGIALKATAVQPQMVIASFECPYCRHIFTIIQSGSKAFKEPYECERESGGCGRKAQKYKLMIDESTYIDSQKIRVQEPIRELRGGDMPRTIDVLLTRDLAGIITPGERIVVNGILRAQQKVEKGVKTSIFEVYVDAVSVEKLEKVFEEIKITPEDELKIRALAKDPLVYEKLEVNMAPTIYGLKEVKRALLLQLFGSSQKHLRDGRKIRGDIHILLVGDAALGKSAIISYQAGLAPRGIYTTGGKSSAAGLTAAVVHDEFGGGRWSLEAGTMALADKGLVALDEADKMRKEDRDALHESLEQQTISISKAGIIATLNSRCALLAAANPKTGRFYLHEPIADQIDMPPTLLSRFDLIFTLLDTPDKGNDTETAAHVLDVHINSLSESEVSTTKSGPEAGVAKEELSQEFIRKYIAFAKRSPPPKLSSEASKKFEDFYVQIRSRAYGDAMSAIPITIRQLESLVRLSEARARARLSDKITEDDADAVIELYMYCMKAVYTDPESGNLDVEWVTQGTSQTRRNRAQAIRTIITDLISAYGSDVPIIAVIDQAEQEGIDRGKAEEMVEKMIQESVLYSPSNGVVRFT